MDLLRLGKALELEGRGRGELLVDDLVTEIDALIADVDTWPGDQLLDLALGLPAEAAEKLLVRLGWACQALSPFDDAARAWHSDYDTQAVGSPPLYSAEAAVPSNARRLAANGTARAPAPGRSTGPPRSRGPKPASAASSGGLVVLDDAVDDAVLPRLLGAHEVVALG